jgi:hypothetical protein
MDIQTLSAHVAAIQSADTREAVGLIYAELVGYDCAADDPDASLSDLRALALGYCEELCEEECILPADVGLDVPDDTTRAFGPGRAAPAWWRA